MGIIYANCVNIIALDRLFGRGVVLRIDYATKYKKDAFTRFRDEDEA